MHAQKLLVTMALLAIGAYTLPQGGHVARNFENALYKLENLDQAVDPPKEPGPVEGHHGGGAGPAKRSVDADQGYEGLRGKRSVEADQGYEGYGSRRSVEADQGYEGLGVGKRSVEADQGYEGLGVGKRSVEVDQGYEGLGVGKRSVEVDQGYEGSQRQKRNFENALDKLENLDDRVDPPKAPGPVEGRH